MGDDIMQSVAGASKPAQGQPIAITARGCWTGMLADMLSQIGPSPMVDATGLTGAFGLQLSG